MKISYQWLHDYVPVRLPPEELADRLTMSGLEVESITDRYAWMESVVAGKVLSVDNHPDSDHLTICSVDIGSARLPIVCGAPNVTAGRFYPVALVGTTLPNGIVIARTQIRGVVSTGMLCSETELGLGTDSSGLMEITRPCAAGDKLTTVLGLADTVLELGLTPNRSDCLSFIGVAREVAAIEGCDSTVPEIDLPIGEEDIHRLSSVTIEAPELCPRYAAGLVVDLTVSPSPFWLQDRLIAIGVKPVNNVVDITNYVMMETGQPLHAFDFDRLAQHRIVVRKAEPEEPFTTLDHKDRRMPENTLMICDGEKPVAVAGVMGGLNSEIDASTRRVLVESAWFHPVSIRKTAKFLGMSTDASHRFERGINPEGVVYALKRTLAFLVTLCGGTMIRGIIDEYPGPPAPVVLTLSASNTNALLGTSIPADDMGPLLNRIGFDTRRMDADQWEVHTPSWRVDISRPVDLMEEIARLSGYASIPVTQPLLASDLTPVSTSQRLRETIRDILTGFGFTEAIHYSFISENACDRLMLRSDDIRRQTVAVLNPLSEDQSVMRTTLIPGLLAGMHRNLSQQQKRLQHFEIGNTFFQTGSDSLPEEREMLAALWTGTRSEPAWHTPEKPCDLYDMKGVVEGLFSALGIPVSFTRAQRDMYPYIRSGYGAMIRIGDTPIGVVGEIHPRVSAGFDLKQTAFVFEISMAPVAAYLPDVHRSVSLPRYPAVSRDATFIVSRAVEAGSILQEISRMNEPLLEATQIFDVFEGGSLPLDRKSVSFRMVYRSAEQTLEDDQVTELHKGICDRLIQVFQAALPGDRIE